MPRSITTYRNEIFLVIAALLVRAVLLGINLHAEHGNLINTIHGDDGYFELSRNLTQGHGFTGEDHPPYVPNPLRPPVYPLFLAIPLYLTGSYWVAVLCQILVGSMIPLLGMMVAEQISGSRRIGWIVGWLLVFEPYGALLSFIFYTETVFTALFLLFLFLLFHYVEAPSLRLSIFTGLLLGLATLVKPTVQYLPMLLPILLAWHWRDRLSKTLFRHLTAFLAVFLLVIAPWLVRNYRAFGVVGMSAQPSFNLMVYLVPSVRALERGTDFQTEYDRWTREQHLDWRNITLATSKAYQDRAIAELEKHPTGIAKSVGVTFITFFTHDGMLVVLQHAGIPLPATLNRPSFLLALKNPVRMIHVLKDIALSPAIIILCARIFWIVLGLLFAAGAVLLIRDRRHSFAASCSLFIVAYFAVTTAINGLGVNARFRIPVNTLIFAFALYACLALMKRCTSILPARFR